MLYTRIVQVARTWYGDTSMPNDERVILIVCHLRLEVVVLVVVEIDIVIW